MKNIILSTVLVLLVSGCADKKIILVPSNTYYPTFPTKDFQKSEKYSLEVWEEQEDVNGTIKKYLVADKYEAFGFIRNTKELRSNYNLLLNRIKLFNNKIKKLNTEQKNKKPIEVNDVNLEDLQ